MTRLLRLPLQPLQNHPRRIPRSVIHDNNFPSNTPFLHPCPHCANGLGNVSFFIKAGKDDGECHLCILRKHARCAQGIRYQAQEAILGSMGPLPHGKSEHSFPSVREIALLLVLLFLGLSLRLALAPAPGYGFDVGVNKGWARSAVLLGLARSYTEQVNGNMLPDYPPFSLVIFSGIGHFYQWFSGQPPHPESPGFHTVIKLPAIVADLSLALLLFFLLRRWKGRTMGFLAAAAFTFHPAVFYDSAYWGQTDSLFTLFMTAALGAFALQWAAISACLFTIALFTKAQTVLLFPLFGLLFLTSGWKTFLRGLVGSSVTTLTILFPFALGGALNAVMNVYLRSIGHYPIVSSAAYNFWWSLYGDSAQSMQDSTLLFGTISHRSVGFLLFGAVCTMTLIFLWQALRPSQPFRVRFPALFLGASTCAFAFFLFNTEMHERYLFPFVALGLPVAFLSLRAARLYAIISFLFLLNLVGWLPFGSIDRAIFRAFPTLDVAIGTAQVICFFLWFILLFDFRRASTPTS